MYTLRDPIEIIKIKNSKIKTALDLGSFKGKVFRNRLTWEFLNSKAKVDRFKSELFFLKNIFNDLEQTTVFTNVEFFYALICLLVYTEYINYSGINNLSNLQARDADKKRLLEFAALGFKLVVSELITNFLNLK